MWNVMGEIVVALLAAAGLLTIGWLLFGRLLVPVGKDGTPIYAVVPACGGGEGLEQTVNGLLWLQGGDLTRLTIVVADAGLNQEGLAAAEALRRKEETLVLCPIESLQSYIKESTKDGRV